MRLFPVELSRYKSSLARVIIDLRPPLASVLSFFPFNPNSMLNAFHAAGECRRQVKKLTKFVKNVKIVKFHDHIWYCNAKCIKISTNMPSIGALICDIFFVCENGFLDTNLNFLISKPYQLLNQARHDCTYFNAFFIAIPNKALKCNIYDILFPKLCKILTCHLTHGNHKHLPHGSPTFYQNIFKNLKILKLVSIFGFTMRNAFK